MYIREFINNNSEKLDHLCSDFSTKWDKKQYYKHNKSNGMCVKVLFEIMSQLSNKHRKIYYQIKDIVWSRYTRMVGNGGNGLVDEFKKYGMQEIETPQCGAFLFIKDKKKNITGHLGLYIKNNRFWHLTKQGFISDDTFNYEIVTIGIF